MAISRRDFLYNSGLILGATATTGDWKTRNPQSAIADLNSDENSLILLGTQGGPFLRQYKQTPSANLVVYNKTPYLVDAGYGTSFKLLETGLAISALKNIFITHHHSDHNLDLGPLIYNSWLSGRSTEIDLFAPKGLKQLIKSYLESNAFDLDTRIKDEGRPDLRKLIRTHEISNGKIFSQQDVMITALKNHHPPVAESFAFKFQLGEKKIIFSGDTGYFPPLIEFAAGADYLVHEVMYAPAIDSLVQRRPNASKLKQSILSHHTAAEEVGLIAAQAKVKNLVLTHFVPSDDKTVTDKMWMDAVSKNFNGNIIVGKDLMKLPL